MQRKVKISLIIVGALGAAAVFGAAGFKSVSAASSPARLAASTGVGFIHHGVGGGIGNEELAAALGITVEELTAAQQEARTAALAQAVDEGLITQAQADELSAGDGTKPMGGRGAEGLRLSGIDYQALLADALGISADDLQAAQTSAQNARIDQAVADGAMTQEQADFAKGQNALRSNSAFQTAMQDAYQAGVNAAVEAGVITQAQADQLLANPANRSFGGHGLEGFGGPRGGRHGSFNPEAPESQTQP